MTTTHVFVDETKRSDYLLAAATLRSQDLGPTRQALAGLLLKGQSRLHMVKERPHSAGVAALLADFLGSGS
jgi:hypothetical protein